MKHLATLLMVVSVLTFTLTPPASADDMGEISCG